MLGRPFKWTDQNREQARMMWERNCSMSEIGSVLGISKGAVSGYTGRNRDLYPTRASKPKEVRPVVEPKQRLPWTQERLLKAAALYARNETIASMAKSMDVSTAAMGDVVKRYPRHFPERARPNSGASAKTSVLSRRTEREARASERSQRGFDSSIFAIPGVPSVRFIDLAANECRFPISSADGPSGASMACCGAKTNASVYCGHHMKISRGDGTRSERRALNGIGGHQA